MYFIKTENLELKLEVVPVETLCLHEKTLPHVVDKLVLEFKNWVNLQNPIIIDENSIVLDGNHRTYVFKELEIKYILVCRIDYFHEKTHLRYWFRILDNIESVDIIRELVEGMGGRFKLVMDRESLRNRLERNRLQWGIQQGDFFASISFNETIVHDAVSAYDELERFQDKLIKKSIGLKYIPCQYVLEDNPGDQLKGDEVIVWTPQITKEMVVDAAKNEKLFAPKATRHLIQARPINANVPTSWFKEDISLDEINERVTRFLEEKSLKRFGPGQVIDGRYYEEALFVFFNQKEEL